MAEGLTEKWFDWLIDQLSDWLTDIPIAWLIDWPIDWSMINQNFDMKLKSKREQFPSSRIRTSNLRMSPETSTVLRSTNWAIEGIDDLVCVPTKINSWMVLFVSWQMSKWPPVSFWVRHKKIILDWLIDWLVTNWLILNSGRHMRRSCVCGWCRMYDVVKRWQILWM